MLNPEAYLANAMDLATGRLRQVGETLSRRMSDVCDLFADRRRARESAEQDNPLVYQVFLPPLEQPVGDEDLLYGTTVIQPGQVGGEYFMTKGHFHADGACPEVYLGCAGSGMLLLMDRGGQSRCIPMQCGSIACVRPDTAHRSVNVGAEPFVFFAVWPRKAGHDYETIARHGFSHRILEQHGRPVMVPNPDWRMP